MSPILPLTLNDVRLAADGKDLLCGISLTIDHGPLSVIMGPNGAGKSLLLRLCHGLLQPSSGSIAWNGQAGGDVAKRQAMVFQKPVVLNRSVLANVEYPLKLRGVPATERRARALEALRKTGFDHMARSHAPVLSGGEQQKLAIARAWVLAPEVLFLDEPTASLDPAGTRDVEALIKAIHDGGTKIVMTSHRLDQVRRIADEVIFLHQGKVVERNTATRFFNSPQSAEARAYLAGELLV